MMTIRLRNFMLVLLVGFGYSLNILQMVPGSSNSHLMFNYKFAKLLHDGGHNVTMLTVVMSLTNINDPQPPKGVEEIRYHTTLTEEQLSIIAASFSDTMFQPVSTAHTISMASAFRLFLVSSCQQLASNESLFEELEERSFDLALGHFFTLCPLGVAHRLNIPHFMWVVGGTFISDSAASMLSLPNPSSFIPFFMADVSDRMTFFERVRSFLMKTLFALTINIPPTMFDLETEAFRGYPEQQFPHLWKLGERTEALFLNGEEFLDFPRPQFPNVMHIGESEHKQPEKLSQEWQTLMDSSEDGVIMFSFGTLANTTMMPIKIKEAFLKAFSAFPTYSIIWILEGEMPSGLDEQKHIKLVTWIPQKDLLHHPKMKLFITHGGYNSVLEAAQAAVPMIFIPLFVDQYGNVRRGQRHGLGVELDKLETNHIVIAETIREVLTNKKYKRNVDRFSTMLSDKIVKPYEQVTLHLIDKISRKPNWWAVRTPKKLNFVQYFCIDVVLVFSFALSTLLALIFKLTVCIVRYMKNRSLLYV